MHPLRLLVSAALATLLCAVSVRAHNAPGSSVYLDFYRDHVRAELRIPLSELELSFGQLLLTDSATGHPGTTSLVPATEILARVERHRAALSAYLPAHVAPRTPDGRAWSVAVLGLSVAIEEEPIDLVVQLRLTPPAGAPLRRFALNYDVVSHEVINHLVFVFVRRDWNHAVFADRPQFLRELRHFAKMLPVDVTGGGAWLGLRYRVVSAASRLAPDHTALLLLFLLPLIPLALTRLPRCVPRVRPVTVP